MSKKTANILSSSEEDEESDATSQLSEEETYEGSSDEEGIVRGKRKGRRLIVYSESEDDDGEAERRALSPRTRKSITGIFRPDSLTDDECSSSEIEYSQNESQQRQRQSTENGNLTRGEHADNTDHNESNEELQSIPHSFVLEKADSVDKSQNSFVFESDSQANSTKNETFALLEETATKRVDRATAQTSLNEKSIESSTYADETSSLDGSNGSIVEASYTEDKSIVKNQTTAVAQNKEIEPRYTMHFDRNVESLLSSTICDFAKDSPKDVDKNKSQSDHSLPSSKSSDDLQVISIKNDPIVLSSGEENLSPVKTATNPTTFAQPKIKNAFQIMPPPLSQITKPKRTPAKNAKDIKIVSQEFYNKECNKLAELKQELLSAQNLAEKIAIKTLPDGGRNLMNRCERLKIDVNIKTKFIESLVVEENAQLATKQPLAAPAIPSWDVLSKGVNEVQPTHTGAKGLQTFNTQKALTEDRLKDLHGSLNSRPREDELADNPKGLNIELMPHQRHALKWMEWREQQKPRGGILADDMGLGKTLSMISLVLAAKNRRKENGENEEEDDDSDDEGRDGWSSKGRRTKYNGGTLIICPASLVNQWETEVKQRVSSRCLTVCVHHGQHRDTKPKHLRTYDMVVTTYNIASVEFKNGGAIFGLKWHRVILDEGHVIRNYKAQMSIAACELRASCRWILTGTPVHNKQLDVYALLKFLRCSPFDDLAHWKRWIDKSAGGQERLRAVMQTLILRRTKAVLQECGALNCLPNKSLQLIEVKLYTDEMNVYQKVMVYSRSLFAQFLYQRAERNSDLNYCRDAMQPTYKQSRDPNGAYYKLHEKFTRMHQHSKEVKSHEILTLLLRLRQICCHPGLIDAMLEDDDNVSTNSEQSNSEIDLLEQLNNLAIQSENEGNEASGGTDDVGAISKASAKVMQRSNPVFNLRRSSSKIACVLEEVKKILKTTTDKAIIVSQWSSVLNIIKDQLAYQNIASVSIDGSVPVKNRQGIMDEFNNPATASRIMLLSLTAGGVGLNLIGANHLLMVDLHWNPQLEAQAQDRIYRVGQKKAVHIYKFMCVDTVEERIKGLQDKKMAMANEVLDGTKATSASQLTMADLKGLFGM